MTEEFLAIEDWRHPYPVEGQRLAKPWFKDWHPWRVSVDMPNLEKILGGFERKRVLDVGCNDGYYGFETAKRGARPVLVDARKAATDRAELVKKTFGYGGQVICGDLQELTFTDPAFAEPFDCTLCYGLLYHLSDPIESLKKLGALTSRVMAVQTFINGLDEGPCLRIIDEPISQPGAGTTPIVTTPSQAAVVKMLHYAGFDHVYRAMPKPYEAARINGDGMSAAWHWAFFYGVKGGPVDLPDVVKITEFTEPLRPFDPVTSAVHAVAHAAKTKARRMRGASA